MAARRDGVLAPLAWRISPRLGRIGRFYNLLRRNVADDPTGFSQFDPKPTVNRYDGKCLIGWKAVVPDPGARRRLFAPVAAIRLEQKNPSRTLYGLRMPR